MSKQPPPAPTASTIGPCPTIIQIVGRPGTGIHPGPSHHPTTPRRKRTIGRSDPVSNLHGSIRNDEANTLGSYLPPEISANRYTYSYRLMPDKFFMAVHRFIYSATVTTIRVAKAEKSTIITSTLRLLEASLGMRRCLQKST